MKAVASKGQGLGLRLEERPRPIPEADEVVLRVDRVGICGSDLHAAYGHGEMAPEGAILGHEFCGTVVAVGSNVKSLKSGDRVAPMPLRGCGCCHSCLIGQPYHCPHGRFDVITGFAQYSRAGARECVPLPPEVDDDAGALIEPLAVGLQGVRKAQISIGARVLVMGAGPIGAFTAYWAQRLGAGSIIVMAQSSRREAIVRSIGITNFISQSSVVDAQEAVCDALGGFPDVVFEAAGTPGAIAQAISFAKSRGTVISLGFFGGSDVFMPMSALMKEVRLLFSICYDRSDFEYTIQTLRYGSHEVRGFITDSIELSKLPQKFEDMYAQRTVDGKVLIAPWR